MMEDLISFLKNNYKWIFSGIGVFVISLIVIKNKMITRQTMKNSSGIMSGGNTTINISRNQNENIRQKND